MDRIDELIWWLVKARVLLCWVPGLIGGIVFLVLALIDIYRMRPRRPAPPESLPKVAAPPPPPGPRGER